jgi:hypothetical protein
VNGIYKSGSRQITVDVLRGYFILSMASAHLSGGLLNKLIHAWVWVDGANGFVCLSGFVLGLSQKAKWTRGIGHAAQLWILRRAFQIWLVATALTTAALLARLYSDDLLFIEDVFRDGRLPSAIADLLLLRLHIPYFGILGMYVLFLAFAYVAVGALKRERDVLVLFASIAVYVASQLLAAWSPPQLGEQQFWRAAWQILFFMGLVAGWHWQDHLRPWASARRGWIFALSAMGTVAFLILAHAAKIPGLDDFALDLSPYFVKFTLSPPIIVYFLFVVTFLASLIEWVRHWRVATPAIQIAALFGRHSLGCFIILSLLQLIAWITVTPNSPHDAKHTALFLASLGLFTLYCLAAEAKPRRRTQPSTDAAETSNIVG